MHDNLIYARVSGDRQTSEQQVAEIRRRIPDQQEILVLEETGSGWDYKGREEYSRLVELVESKSVGNVWVWKLDRLGRSFREIMKFVDKCRDNGVRLQSITETLDTDSVIGRMVIGILASMAELEKDMISERTKLKLRSKAKNGWKHPGSPKNWFKEEVIKREKVIRTLAASGLFAWAIGKELGVDFRTIKKVLATEPGKLLTKEQAIKEDEEYKLRKKNQDTRGLDGKE